MMAPRAQARSRYGRNELQPEESTPLWKLVLRQFDDLLVKVGAGNACSRQHVVCLLPGSAGRCAESRPPCCRCCRCRRCSQILLVAAVVDFVIALTDGESIFGWVACLLPGWPP
jgi:hypothetical protein